MTGRFENKVAVVIGGGTGLGLAAAKRFVAEGGSAVIVGRSADVLAEAARAIDPSGARLATLAVDAGHVGPAGQAVALATTRFGGVDVLLNNEERQ